MAEKKNDKAEKVEDRQVFGARVFYWRDMGMTEKQRELISETPVNTSQLECKYLVVREHKLRAIPADVVGKLSSGKWEVNQLLPRRISYVPNGCELSATPRPRCFTFDLPGGSVEFIFSETVEDTVFKEMTPDQKKRVADTIKEKFPAHQRGELVGSSMRG